LAACCQVAVRRLLLVRALVPALGLVMPGVEARAVREALRDNLAGVPAREEEQVVAAVPVLPVV
jgi:hypothetical protein